jgi:hypothetical protein
MAIAREIGIRDLLGVCIGAREGFDEASVAVPYARELGYRCEAFLEEDLDLRGHLEPFVAHCGYPPKHYNHLLLSAAFADVRPRGGQLWTGDIGFWYANTVFQKARRLRRTIPWPPPGFWRAFLPLQPIMGGRVRSGMWLLSLDVRQAAAAAMSPARDYESACRVVELVGARRRAFDPAPQLLEGIAGTMSRYPALHRRAWNWMHKDVVAVAGFRSRGLLARDIGAHLDYPFKDIALYAFTAGLHEKLPPGYQYNNWQRHASYEHWLPRERWASKKGLVGRLNRWFRDPKKLGEYRDIIASRDCLQRGIFDQKIVRRLLHKARDLNQHEARLLWIVLTTELLFRGRTLLKHANDRIPTDSGPGPTRERRVGALSQNP